MQEQRFEPRRGRRERGGNDEDRRRGRVPRDERFHDEGNPEPRGRFDRDVEGQGSWAGMGGDSGQEDDGERYRSQRGEGRFERESSGWDERRGPGERGRFGGGEDWMQPRFASDRDREQGSGYEEGGYGRGRFGQGGGGRERWETGRGAMQRGGFGSQPESEQSGGWQQTGTHLGKGPKGYRRADERVLDDVCHALERDPRIDASDIEVTCTNGEVTLRGTVDSRQTKRRAEECVEELPGVRDVRNELRTQQAKGSGEQAASGASGSRSQASGRGSDKSGS